MVKRESIKKSKLENTLDIFIFGGRLIVGLWCFCLGLGILSDMTFWASYIPMQEAYAIMTVFTIGVFVTVKALIFMMRYP